MLVLTNGNGAWPAAEARLLVWNPATTSFHSRLASRPIVAPCSAVTKKRVNNETQGKVLSITSLSL